MGREIESRQCTYRVAAFIKKPLPASKSLAPKNIFSEFYPIKSTHDVQNNAKLSYNFHRRNLYAL
jgi:hypothetical protein